MAQALGNYMEYGVSPRVLKFWSKIGKVERILPKGTFCKLGGDGI